jgi:hypothetical protein
VIGTPGWSKEQWYSLIFLIIYLFCFETRSLYVAQAGFELVILLLRLPSVRFIGMHHHVQPCALKSKTNKQKYYAQKHFKKEVTLIWLNHFPLLESFKCL